MNMFLLTFLVTLTSHLILLSVGVSDKLSLGHGQQSPSTFKVNGNLVKVGESKVTTRWIKLTLEEEPQMMDIKSVNGILKGRRRGVGTGYLDMTGLNPHPKMKNFTLDIPKSIRFKETVTSLLSGIKLKPMKLLMGNFTKFKNRLATSIHGKRAGDWLRHRINFIANESRLPITIWEWCSFSWEYRQTSIFARIDGLDAKLKDEVIILGANMDSINLHQNRWPCRDFFDCDKMDAPGADDNASGVIVLLEALRLLAKFGEGGFKRSIEIHFYAASEYGLRGSLVTASTYRKKGHKVVGMLSVAQAGYAPTNPFVYRPVPVKLDSNSKDGWKVAINVRETDFQLNQFLRLLIDSYLDVGWEDRIFCVGCYADYASWTEFGYASAFAYGSEYSPEWHRRTDTIETIKWDYLLEFVKLAVGFAVEFGEPFIPDAHKKI